MNIIEENIPYFNFLVSPLSGKKVEEILEKVDEGVIHYLKVNSKEWLFDIIKKETHLFSYKSPLDGIDDLGNDIEDELNLVSLEDLNTLKKENDNYFAKSNGLLVKYESIIKFIPITYNGTCEVKVSEDKKNATANFYPASDEGKQLTENDVIQIIKGKGISVNLEMIEIISALDWVNMSNEVLDQVIIAKGKDPKLGVDGWTEYLFDTELKTGPVIDEHGNTDYHNLNLIESVSENQKIGIYHLMVEGEDGYDVFGQKILPPKQIESKPPNGKNIYFSEKEPTHIFSKIDGSITLVGTEIIISNLYNIRGDVDFHTGSIVSKGSLNILGNVKSGFNLDMSETITIGGYVKDSKLVTGGDVTIRGGFSGTGEGTIIAGGNVNIRYIRNQIVYSHGDISVEKEVVEAKLFAKGDIKSINNKMLLIGGHSIAGGDIIANALGHEYGIETIVEVGYDYDVIEQICKYDNECKTIKKSLIILKEQIKNSLGNGVVGKLSKALLIKHQIIKKNYDTLKNKRKELRNSITNYSGSRVIVSGKIYPGVKIVIDDYKYKVKEIMHSKIFSVSTEKEEIVVDDKS